MEQCQKTYTYLHTIENQDHRAAVKFESLIQNRSGFVVTLLNDPQVTPFRMEYAAGEWVMEDTICNKVRSIKKDLIEIADKFKK